MKKKKKYLVLPTIVFFLIIIIATSFIEAGELSLTINSPFETIAWDNLMTYKDELTQATRIDDQNVRLEITPITTKFDEIDDYNELDSITTPYCQVGGQYTAKVANEISNNTLINCEINNGENCIYDTINLTHEVLFDLYYCYTTKDLLKMIKIPTSWSANNLIIYCNDGSNINVKNTNFDLFTTQLNTYKACIVKNLDIEKSNTLLYGLEVGNKEIDSDETYFYNETTGSGPAFTQLNNKGNGIFEDDNNKEFYLNYNSDTKIFVMSDFEPDLSIPISSIFNLDELELSRVALLKKIGNKKIIGYETITKKITNIPEYENSLKTLYTIKLEGFNFQSGECENILAQYKTITSSAIMKNDDISCTEDTIQIISESLDGGTQTTSTQLTSPTSNSTITTPTTNPSSNSTTTTTSTQSTDPSTTSTSSSTSFHVFKNIILSLE